MIMSIQDGIKLLLQTNDSAGWSQMNREELIVFAGKNKIAAAHLFADACLTIGIGEGTPGSKVQFNFRRFDGKQS